MGSPASPIADLTYRGYDGNLEPPMFRWWSIAKMTMRLATKKKGFWVWSVISGYWYLVLIAIFYFADNFFANFPSGSEGFFRQIVWKDLFLDGFSIGQILFMVVALLIGAGSIANDNRANALLVYLSKPCTKLDYLAGKWFGLFIPITLVTAVPMVLFYLYCLMSYRSYGFFTNDPWLFIKILAMCPVAACFHASVLLGISSMFKQGRLAGATYAGIYFLSNFVTAAIGGAIRNPRGHVPPIANTFYYFSIDGIQIAMAKLILGTRGSSILTAMGNGRRQMAAPPEIPSAALFISLYFLLCIVSLWIAWIRIRPVEVVGN